MIEQFKQFILNADFLEFHAQSSFIMGTVRGAYLTPSFRNLLRTPGILRFRHYNKLGEHKFSIILSIKYNRVIDLNDTIIEFQATASSMFPYSRRSPYCFNLISAKSLRTP